MTYTIQELRHGSGYMIVTRDDGSTFGQTFHNMPVDDPAALDEALASLAEDRAMVSQPSPQKVPHRDVLDKVLIPVTINPNRPRGVVNVPIP